jgi:anti-sigma regulatory factor (Ser/Thr protein kinase)
MLMNDPLGERSRPSPAPRRLDKSYPALARSVGQARREVSELAARAGAGGAAIEGIRLAVSEAVTNAIVHGARGRDGSVEVSVRVHPRRLKVTVRDQGPGPRVPAAHPGLGGGLPAIALVSEHFSLAERRGGGAEIVMLLPLKVSDGDRLDAVGGAASRPPRPPRRSQWPGGSPRAERRHGVHARPSRGTATRSRR